MLTIILEMREKHRQIYDGAPTTHISDVINFRLLNFSKHQSQG